MERATLVIHSTPEQVQELPEWARGIYDEFLARLNFATSGTGLTASALDEISEKIARDFHLAPASVYGALGILAERGILAVRMPGG